MEESKIKFYTALTVSIALCGMYFAFSIYKKKKKKFTSGELLSYPWKTVATIKSLWIYPVKSCRGISVPQYSTRKEGPMVGQFRDRSFVIVDRQNIMVTARKNPSLVNIIPTLNHEAGSLILSYEDTEPLVLSIQLIEGLGEPCVVSIWNSSVPGIDCGDEAAEWLETVIGAGHKLVYHRDEKSKRMVKESSEFYYVLKTDGALYADQFGYLLTTTSSLQDLNDRSGENLPVQNFRPNIHIENDTAYEEDDWTYLQIGGIHFRNVKHCDRCIFTTIDYQSGRRNPNCEPLKTLKTYRLGKNGDVLFGINLAIYNSEVREGTLSVGDIILASDSPRIGK